MYGGGWIAGPQFEVSDLVNSTLSASVQDIPSQLLYSDVKNLILCHPSLKRHNHAT